MKKICIILIYSFFSNIASSQISSPKADNTLRKWKFGVNLSPELCYRNLHNNGPTVLMDPIVQRRNIGEGIRWGYTAGILANKQFSKRFSFETGLQFAVKGYQTKNFDIFIFQPNSPSSGEIKFRYSFNYWEVPLRVLWNFKIKEARVIAGAGLSLGYLSNATVTTIKRFSDDIYRSKTEYPTGYRYHNVFPHALLGVNLPLSKQSELRIATVFNYGVVDVLNGQIPENFISLGQNITLFYKIK